MSQTISPCESSLSSDAVTVVNEDSGGEFVILCEHASNKIPRNLDKLGLDRSTLNTHIAVDLGAAKLALSLAKELNSPAVLAGYSRLYCDCNRDPDVQDEVFPSVSSGVVIPGNMSLSRNEREHRLRVAFHTFHDTAQKLIFDRCRKGTPVRVLSIHSCTPIYDGKERPWPLGIIYNQTTPLVETLLHRLGKLGFELGDNQPYDGRVLVGYTMKRHGESNGLDHAVLEFRNDVISRQSEIVHWTKLVSEAVAPSHRTISRTHGED